MFVGGEGRGGRVWGPQKKEGKHTTPRHSKYTQTHNRTTIRTIKVQFRFRDCLFSLLQFNNFSKSKTFFSFFPFSSLESTMLILYQHEISYSFSIMSFLIHTQTHSHYILHTHQYLYIYINVRFCFHCFLVLLFSFFSSFSSFFLLSFNFCSGFWGCYLILRRIRTTSTQRYEQCLNQVKKRSEK